MAIPVEIDRLPGEWLAHADALAELDAGAWQPRTTLLGPFDPLVADRDRALRLFDFRFKLEIYIPVAKREFGYYVLPILHGDRLIGRIDPAMDRKRGVFTRQRGLRRARCTGRRLAGGLRGHPRAGHLAGCERDPAAAAAAGLGPLVKDAAQRRLRRVVAAQAVHAAAGRRG